MRRKLLLTTLTALVCITQAMAESNSSNFEVKIKIIRNTKNKFADNSQKTKYRLSASVINGKEKSAIAGDLVSEIQTWLRPNKITEIEVFGLEHCTAKNARGFCASKVRK